MGVAAKKVALKDSSLKAMKPAPTGKRATVWDALMPNMAVRVTDKGRRSFFAVKRRAGDASPSWVLLGTYPTMSLGEARAAAREALIALGEGKSPKAIATAKHRAQEAAARDAAESTFGAIAERFIREYLPTIKSSRVYTARIRRELLPVLGDKPIAEIQRRDVIRLLEGISGRSGKAAAIGALSVLRKLLNWAMARDLMQASPAAAVKPGEIIGKTKPRDRLLSDDELASVWRAIDAVGEPFGSVYRLLLLTGARRQEIAAARWEDFDEKAATLTIPAERSKTGDAMLVPLSPAAVKLIAAMPRFNGPYIFTTTAGRMPISGFAVAKSRLDATIAVLGEIPPFVIHDFRRAVRSNLGRLGVDTVVAELCLGHRQKGIVGVYDRHSYFDEKRTALRRWERKLLSIVAPGPLPGKVVALHARGQK